MLPTLVPLAPHLPTPTPEGLALVRAIEDRVGALPQVEVTTQHVFHTGVYARTMKLVPGQIVVGALIKRTTLLIVNGSVDVLLGDTLLRLDGYHVIPASAGRKQVFLARDETHITMLFPTRARTVEEAEREFTDEYERLASHVGINEVVMTGE